MNDRLILLIAIVTIVLTSAWSALSAQSIYRYKDNNGQWQYSDRPPVDGRKADVQDRVKLNLNPKVTVTREKTPEGTVLVANNEYHGPIQLSVNLTDTKNVGGGAEAMTTEVVLPPAAKTHVLAINPADPTKRFSFRYNYRYLLGTPNAEHDDEKLYRVPYSVGASFPVSQAYPSAMTHDGTDSQYAIDFAMPEGTAVHAARSGTVVAIAYQSFSGGTDASDAQKANLVRILHDDDTLAVYAHLALNSVRVRPGDRISAGQYIADSGNTGFSSGPHLHFAVERNIGFEIESLPVNFTGLGGRPVQAKTGEILTSY